MLKIPAPQSPALSFGSSVHATLRDFYYRQISKTPTPFPALEDLLKSNWIAVGYSSIEHEQLSYKKALTILQNFLQKNFKLENLPVALEFPFEFYLKNQTGKEGVWIGGRIDRIDKHADGTIEIIDYKTGSNIPDEKDLQKNLQLTTYALASTMIRETIFNKKPDKVLLSLFYIEENKKFTTTRTIDQIELAKEELLAKTEEIATSDFLCSGSIFCKNCEYKILCQTKN